MCLCVCVCVCVCVCTHTHTNSYTCVCTQIYPNKHARARAHTHTHTRYVREDWNKLVSRMGAYVSNSPRGHFRHVSVLRRNGNRYLLYDRRLSPLAPQGDRVGAPAGLVPTKAAQGVACAEVCARSGWLFDAMSMSM